MVLLIRYANEMQPRLHHSLASMEGSGNKKKDQDPVNLFASNQNEWLNTRNLSRFLLLPQGNNG